MRKNIYALSVILIFSFVKCNDDESLVTNACTSSASTDNVLWIAELKKTMTNCTCETSIIKGTYEGQIVFFIAVTDPVCNGVDMPTLYSCGGDEIRTFTSSPADQKELREKLIRDSVLYRCKK